MATVETDLIKAAERMLAASCTDFTTTFTRCIPGRAPQQVTITVAVRTDDEEVHDRYSRYQDDCERVNKIPLAFHAWQLREEA